MTKTLRIYLLLIAAIQLCISSCSIEKRHYRSGYSFEWKNSTSGNTKANPAESPSTHENLVASNKNDVFPVENNYSSSLPQTTFSIDECDRIYLLNGKIIKAKIKSNSNNLVTYTLCDSAGKGETTLSTKEIKALKYANGNYTVLNKVETNENGNKVKHVYSKQELDSISKIPKTTAQIENEKIASVKKKNWFLGVLMLLTIVSIVLAVLGLWAGFLGATIFSIIGLLIAIRAHKISKKINYNKGRKISNFFLAFFGTIFTSVLVLIVYLLIYGIPL